MNEESRLVANMAQWIHSGLQESLRNDGPPSLLPIRGLKFRLFNALRKQMLHWSDPVIAHELPDRSSVMMHLSHNYPYIKVSNPYYDTSLGRLASFIEREKGALAMIDVGANVGDTLWQMGSSNEGRFLCIEGDDKYFPLLESNVRAKGSSALCVKAICDEVVRESQITFVQKGGTSYISEDAGAGKQHHQTVDQIVKASGFRPNLLKIDTDGYDYKVLRGSRELLRAHRPVLFFELSPKHLSQAGEDPASIFPVLAELGYEQVLFYDNCGFPMVKVPTTAQDQLGQVLTYASSKAGFYMDALLFHGSDAKLFDVFSSAEVAYFGNDAAKRPWPR